MKTGYYWVKPSKWEHEYNWVIAVFKDGLFYINGTGEALTPDSMF